MHGSWGLLGVGAMKLEQVLSLENKLRPAGLLDPANLASWGPERVTRDLYNSGYQRGMLTGMYADRLTALGEFATKPGQECEAVLASGDRKAVETLMLPVFGIGPKVIDNFLSLRERMNPGTCA